MLQTLWTIPHAWLGTPLMTAWLVGCVVTMLVLVVRRGFSGSLISTLGMFAVGFVAIRWLLPQIEILGIDVQNPDGPLVSAGLAIRGYGLFLMFGIVAGITLCQWRARQIAIDSELIFSLCFWLVVFGLLGARLFYIIQKWNSYASAQSTAEMLSRLADLTEGGLVVYGSLVGGLATWIVFCWLNKLPLWKVGDIMAPAMMIGLGLGRIGCLMNGCCYGEPCQFPSLGLSFPAGSPAYYRQLESGGLLGISLELVARSDGSVVRVVRQVEAGSPAENQGIRVGDRIERIALPDDIFIRAVKERGIAFDSIERATVIVQREAGPLVAIPVADLPDRSGPIWPSQILSSVSAFLLCGLLWFYYPFRRVDGELMAWLLIFYSMTRSLEEIIRADEVGILGQKDSIGLWVSAICFAGGVSLLILRRTTARTPTASDS